MHVISFTVSRNEYITINCVIVHLYMYKRPSNFTRASEFSHFYHNKLCTKSLSNFCGLLQMCKHVQESLEDIIVVCVWETTSNYTSWHYIDLCSRTIHHEIVRGVLWLLMSLPLSVLIKHDYEQALNGQ